MISRAPSGLHGDIVTFVVSPPSNLYDWDASDAARNEAYCRELEALMLAYELDPRNFFRIGKPGPRTAGYPR